MYYIHVSELSNPKVDKTKDLTSRISTLGVLDTPVVLNEKRTDSELNDRSHFFLHPLYFVNILSSTTPPLFPLLSHRPPRGDFLYFPSNPFVYLRTLRIGTLDVGP